MQLGMIGLGRMGANMVRRLSHSESSPGYAGEAVKVQQFQE